MDSHCRGRGSAQGPRETARTEEDVKPIRDPEYLAFVRSLPCSVPICTRDRFIEPDHVGKHGMGQKCSDRETIPLCGLHHRERHRVGLKQFAQIYNMDVVWIVSELNRKPRLFLEDVIGAISLYPPAALEVACWSAEYRGETFRLLPISLGIRESIELARELCREHLIETFFAKSRTRVSVSRRTGVAPLREGVE